MKKNKLYIFLPIMTVTIFFIVAGTCIGGETRPGEEEYIEEVEQASKDIKKENTAVDETGSKQPEDIPELEEQNKSIPITLNGVVNSEAAQEPLTITIYKEKGKVEGEASLGWWEEIEVNGEGDEDHHSERYTCLIKLTKGTILGTIDERGNINATISGFSYSDYGYLVPGESTDEIVSLCMEKIKNRPESFVLKGKYQESNKYASGSVLPKGWDWWTN